MFATDSIVYTKEGPVATITLNRPQALNAISPDLGRGLNAAMTAGSAS
jgi:enoyl-CoA hydratase/carnithine racemase